MCIINTIFSVQFYSLSKVWNKNIIVIMFGIPYFDLVLGIYLTKVTKMLQHLILLFCNPEIMKIWNLLPVNYSYDWCLRNRGFCLGFIKGLDSILVYLKFLCLLLRQELIIKKRQRLYLRYFVTTDYFVNTENKPN